MTERPILFSAPMVRALLAGAKTQTRRVFKQATGPSLSVGMVDDAPGVAELSWLHGDGPGHEVEERIAFVACPYGAPGDRLWVREAHSLQNRYGNVWCRYRADDAHVAVPAPQLLEAARDGWRPSIHMPRWASRITLEVTGVRVERLQEISDEDAKAEGIVPFGDGNGWNTEEGRHYMGDPVNAYASLWETINGPGSWAANPWVWCVEFRRA